MMVGFLSYIHINKRKCLVVKIKLKDNTHVYYIKYIKLLNLKFIWISYLTLKHALLNVV